MAAGRGERRGTRAIQPGASSVGLRTHSLMMPAQTPYNGSFAEYSIVDQIVSIGKKTRMIRGFLLVSWLCAAFAAPRMRGMGDRMPSASDWCRILRHSLTRSLPNISYSGDVMGAVNPKTDPTRSEVMAVRLWREKLEIRRSCSTQDLNSST